MDPVGCANNPNLCDDPILAKDICASSCNLCNQDVTTPTSIQTTVSSPTTTEMHTTTTTTKTAKSMTTTITTKSPTILTTENLSKTTETTTKYGQVDGAWTLWNHWSHCSVTCGSGTWTRHRACSNPSPRYGGHTCSGTDHETTSCQKATCPIDGGWGSWGHWRTCSVTCGTGIKIRHRSCTYPAPQYGGTSCVGSPTSQKQCTHNVCPITCPTHWDRHGSSCYYVSTTRHAWSYSKHYCKNHSSFLVEIDNAAEDSFILNELSNHDIIGVWTGGNDISKEGHYVWDGSRTAINYTHWAPGQPDGNNTHRPSHDCIKVTSAHWFDESCTNTHHFICEQKFNSAGTNVFG
ncbi:thrombospondin-2-like isoform X1 [Mya arenaria]|uniref:thrombospondin-2-like isoform X1 n=1 Tax=Mya arenaria TaxID=6604 RepID=UPI0022E815FD|nr:thrombospondin-2-like isoform X1 [Mya arenaria]